MNRYLIVGLAGGIGSIARYAVILWTTALFGTTFPIGTLIVNVVGSLLLGFIMYLGTAAVIISPEVRLALTTGIMGGFTTYSTFNYETTVFFREGAWLYGALNIVVTITACLLGGVIGFALARMIVGR